MRKWNLRYEGKEREGNRFLGVKGFVCLDIIAMIGLYCVRTVAIRSQPVK